MVVDGSDRTTRDITPVSSGTESFTLDTRQLANGPHSLQIRVTDSSNNVGNSSSVSFSVNNDIVAPTINVTSPSGGQTVSGPSVPVTATFNDNVAVTRIELLVNGQIRSTSTTISGSQQSFTFDSTTLANGSHTIQARAYDAAGNLGNSPAVSVNVSNVVANPPERLYAANVVPPNSLAIGPAYAVETAQRVSFSCAGTIRGVWWHRPAADTGTNTVSAWRGTTLVARATGNPNATGWVYIAFATPISVAINDSLLISVHRPNGAYSYRTQGFTNRTVTSTSGCMRSPASTAVLRMVCTFTPLRRHGQFIAMLTANTLSAQSLLRTRLRA